MNKDAMDMLNVMSFYMGVLNYNENLTQNDKQDIVNELAKQNKDVVAEIHQHLQEQDKLLRDILEMLHHDS